MLIWASVQQAFDGKPTYLATQVFTKYMYVCALLTLLISPFPWAVSGSCVSAASGRRQRHWVRSFSPSKSGSHRAAAMDGGRTTIQCNGWRKNSNSAVVHLWWLCTVHRAMGDRGCDCDRHGSGDWKTVLEHTHAGPESKLGRCSYSMFVSFCLSCDIQLHLPTYNKGW